VFLIVYIVVTGFVCFNSVLRFHEIHAPHGHTSVLPRGIFFVFHSVLIIRQMSLLIRQ
jgi:hypothetical protein